MKRRVNIIRCSLNLMRSSGCQGQILSKSMGGSAGGGPRRGPLPFMSSLSAAAGKAPTSCTALPRMSCMMTHVQRISLSAGFPTQAGKKTWRWQMDPWPGAKWAIVKEKKRLSRPAEKHNVLGETRRSPQLQEAWTQNESWLFCRARARGGAQS